MEGNYYFRWQSIAASGAIEGEYEQVIYGPSLQEACETFETMHGPLVPDENGVANVITCVTWQPL